MGILISFEGIDGSGKGTQASLLKDRLMSEGVPVDLISFPRYGGTVYGRLVGQYLNGDFGNLDEIDPRAAALLYAGDRLESKDALIESLCSHHVVILDRYVNSNVAHQASKFPSGRERWDMIHWITDLEYGTNKLPRENLIIELSIPVDLAMERVSAKLARRYTDKKHDLHEADRKYLTATAEVYKTLRSRIYQPIQWVNVKGVEEANLTPAPRTPEEIHDEVWHAIHSKLPFVRF